MSSSTVLSLISRLERIADTVPTAMSEDELRSLGSQAMGTAMAIKEELESLGISTQSSRMYDLTKSYDYGSSLPVLRRNVQIVLHQVAGYYRGLAERL